MIEKLLNDIEDIRLRAKTDMGSIVDPSSAENVRVKYLGKKGSVTSILKSMADIEPSERPRVGKEINKLKVELEEKLREIAASLTSRQQSERIATDRLDISLPGRKKRSGHFHPIKAVMNEIVVTFNDLGFSVFDGPEIETDYYNFEALNFLENHPARDMHDTFYVEGKYLLRTHTSPVQVRVMEKLKPPIAAVFPGAVYRRDNDITHSPMFYQVEGLMVGEDVTMRHLKGILSTFCRRTFGDKVGVRFRPSFFPFTEPSAEIDIECVMCKGRGCRVCKGSGWLEILGCGMVDPSVLKGVGLDPRKISGFAFGLGVDRIAMLKYAIDDIRLFYENDLRFLEQFK